MIVCIDSSLLVSLYIMDSNSAKAVQRMRTQPQVWITPLHRCELAHAIHRCVFRKQFSEFEARTAWQKFEADCTNGTWGIFDFSQSTWAMGVHLAQRQGSILGMRTLDSLHVACALELQAERFWTFDERQRRLAEAVGLDTRA
ncbi:MAG: type II toxin-antitoxin system VapC family toxin [Acidobacteriota bacterium]